MHTKKWLDVADRAGPRFAYEDEPPPPPSDNRVSVRMAMVEFDRLHRCDKVDRHKEYM